MEQPSSHGRGATAARRARVVDVQDPRRALMCASVEQVYRRGQAGEAAADDGDPLGCRRRRHGTGDDEREHVNTAR